MSHYLDRANELIKFATQCKDQEAKQILLDGAEKIKSLIPKSTISPEAAQVLFNMRNKKK